MAIRLGQFYKDKKPASGADVERYGNVYLNIWISTKNNIRIFIGGKQYYGKSFLIGSGGTVHRNAGAQDIKSGDLKTFIRRRVATSTTYRTSGSNSNVYYDDSLEDKLGGRVTTLG